MKQGLVGLPLWCTVGDIVRVSPRHIFEMRKWGCGALFLAAEGPFGGPARYIIYITLWCILIITSVILVVSTSCVCNVGNQQTSIYILRKDLCGNNAGKHDKVIKDL